MACKSRMAYIRLLRPRPLSRRPHHSSCNRNAGIQGGGKRRSLCFHGMAQRRLQGSGCCCSQM